MAPKSAPKITPAYSLLHEAANDWTPAAKLREEITRDAWLEPYGGFAFINLAWTASLSN